MAKEDLDYIIEAAQRAPIAGGDRAMSHITVVTDEGLLDEIRQTCMRKLKQYPELVEKLGLPEGYTILSSLVVGYAVEDLVQRELTDLIAVDWI